MIGNAYSFKFKVTKNDVMVVPMFAPRMIPIACGKVINPARTNPTVMAVVPLDDWINAVMMNPMIHPPKILEGGAKWVVSCANE